MSILPTDSGNLDLQWAEKMPGGVITPKEYLAYVRRLLEQGSHQFRREGVFYAVPLTGLRITTTDDAGHIEKETVQEAEPLILRFDNDRYASEIDRKKAVRQIYTNAAERRLTQERLNNPDFMGPDIWTWTQKQWDKELPHLVKHPSEAAMFTFTDEGWDNTSRIILDDISDKALSFPVAWGSFDIDAHGGIATYTHVLEDLKNSVQKIDQLLATANEIPTDNQHEKDNIENAIIVSELFKLNAGSEDTPPSYVTKHDIYGQKAGFAEANFHEREAHERARANQASVVHLFGAQARRTLKYGPPGFRAKVPNIAQIDAMMERHRRRQGPEALAA